MCNLRERFESFTNGSGQVRVWNNDTIESLGFGSVKLITVVRGINKEILLTTDLYTFDLIYNLISASQARKKGFRVMTDSDDRDPFFRGCADVAHKVRRDKDGRSRD